MKSKVTVILPVYRDAPNLANLVRKISRWKDCELLIVADEPTSKCLEALKIVSGKAKIMVNGCRIGKANALNKALEHSTGDILLFIDGDVDVDEAPSFPSKLSEEMGEADILDLRKEVVKEGFTGKMRYYEILGVNVGSWLLSSRLGRSPGLVGSAFAIRREALERLGGFRRTVWEDADLGVRAFIDGLKFRYSENLTVRLYASADVKTWISQERRAGVGASLIVKEWGTRLIRSLLKTPHIFLLSLLVFLPSLLLLLVNLLTIEDIAYWIVPSIAITSPLLSRLNMVFPAILGLTPFVPLIKTGLASAVSFIASASISYLFSRKLKFKFNIYEYALYYFIYSPLKLLVFLSGFIQVFILRKRETPGWKI